jgi:hypothetical protein
MFEKMQYQEYYGYMKLLNSRTVGAYPDFNTACKAVIENTADICETIYDYALVQEIQFGIYPHLIRQKLFFATNKCRISNNGEEIYNVNLTFKEIEMPLNFIESSYSLG